MKRKEHVDGMYASKFAEVIFLVLYRYVGMYEWSPLVKVLHQWDANTDFVLASHW